MTTIIQIFKSVRIIEKPDYTPESRKQLGIWPESIESASGYVENGKIYLPASLKDDLDIYLWKRDIYLSFN